MKNYSRFKKKKEFTIGYLKINLNESPQHLLLKINVTLYLRGQKVETIIEFDLLGFFRFYKRLSLVEDFI
jgi:hypothetical protein